MSLEPPASRAQSISPVPAAGPGAGDNARADEDEGSNLEPNKGKSKKKTKKTLAQPESQLLEEGLGFLLALQML